MASGVSLDDHHHQQQLQAQTTDSLEAELRSFFTSSPHSICVDNPSELFDLWFNSLYSTAKLPLCVDHVRDAVEVLIDKILCEERMRSSSSSNNHLQSLGVERKMVSHSDLIFLLRNAAIDPTSSSTKEELEEAYVEQIARVRETLRMKIPNLNNCPFYQAKMKYKRKVSPVIQYRGTRRSKRCLERLNNFESNKLTKRIPIGPEFQAEVSKWDGTPNSSTILDAAKRLLGTRLWPLSENHMEPNPNEEIVVGKGRSHFCSCSAPGSVSCSRSHVNEARLELRAKLGPAYTDLGFDEMGEVVSSSWTPEEQSTFETLVRQNPLSQGKGFFDAAVSAFPSKKRRDIVSYYFNVFIQRQISIKCRGQEQTAVQSDDDDDYDDADDDDIKGRKASNYLRRFSGQHKGCR